MAARELSSRLANRRHENEGYALPWPWDQKNLTGLAPEDGGPYRISARDRPQIHFASVARGTAVLGGFGA